MNHARETETQRGLRMRFSSAATALALFLVQGQAMAAIAQAGPRPAAGPPPQSPADPPDSGAARDENDNRAPIIVTARIREEPLSDVPVAVTVHTPELLRERQIYAVKDIAAFSPGLIINTDTIGRAFVSIRGVGSSLVDSVQPGVGLFIDGVYEPNTSYLNSPLLDVERIEVLRGPQGTLFGHNTLAGAINVITRAPSDVFAARFDGAYAGPDEFMSASGSVSGPVVPERLQLRLGTAFHSRGGFMRNRLTGDRAYPIEQNSVSGTLRFVPAPWARILVDANHHRVEGGSAGYFQVEGPRDYSLDGFLNVNSVAAYRYAGMRVRGTFDVASLGGTITAILAYDWRESHGVQDADLSPIDLLRLSYGTRLGTRSGELRLDARLNARASVLLGVSALRTATDSYTSFHVVDAGTSSPASDRAETEFRAVFGTLFVDLGAGLDLAAGLRYDHQNINVASAATAGVYRAGNIQPRVTLSRRWTPSFMSYGSIARGSRGGGANPPGAPNLLYRGDSVWTYEVGARFGRPDQRLRLDVQLFYNDYDDYIGQNSLAPSTTGAGYVPVNLNSGHVTSYGAEAELHAQLTGRWRVDGALTLLHARITDDTAYFETTGFHVSSPRLIFTPDWNFHLATSYALPLRSGRIVFQAGIVGKGSRVGISLDPDVAPLLSAYYLVDGSITWRRGGTEIALFAKNLFNDPYIESYLDQSILARAGLPPPFAHNLAIQGERRRIGVRVGFRF